MNMMKCLFDEQGIAFDGDQRRAEGGPKHERPWEKPERGIERADRDVLEIRQDTEVGHFVRMSGIRCLTHVP